MSLESRYDTVCEWWAQLTDEQRHDELDAWVPSFAYHSVRIEDEAVTHAHTREIFESDSVTNYSGPLSTLCEIKGQKDSFARMIGDLAARRPFDESLVLETHENLTWGTYSAHQLADGERPGTYRLGDYLVPGANEVGAPAEDVPQLVSDLCGEVAAVINTLSERRALTVACYFHTAFEVIHPFSDGSGLTGRELMNHILLRGGHPPVTIFFDEKADYYDALEAFNRRGTLTPFKQLVRRSVARTWEGELPEA